MNYIRIQILKKPFFKPSTEFSQSKTVKLAHMIIKITQLKLTPYGDYYQPVFSDYGDGDVFVW